MSSAPRDERRPPELTDRQTLVLRAVVSSYVGDAAPVGSQRISHVLTEQLSSASIRSTLVELAELDLVEKPHASAGRVPTERGLRLFVDDILDRQLFDRQHLAAYDRRTIAYSVGEARADTIVEVASQLLSEQTRQLGFVVAPRLDRVVMRHLSLVRLSSERVLAVLVSEAGAAHRRVIEADSELDQRQLDRVATELSVRVRGRTLRELRDTLVAEARSDRAQADRTLRRVVELGLRAVDLDDESGAELVIATRLALLDQPEFHDSRRIRDLFEALETKERLIEVLNDVIAVSGVSVAFGEEVGEPGLRHCALVAAPYGDGVGTLGVIGPSRMDYQRIIPLVQYLSHAITQKLGA